LPAELRGSSPATLADQGQFGHEILLLANGKLQTGGKSVASQCVPPGQGGLRWHFLAVCLVGPDRVPGNGLGTGVAGGAAHHEFAVLFNASFGKIQNAGLAGAHGVAAAPVKQNAAFGLLRHFVHAATPLAWPLGLCFDWQQRQARAHGLAGRNGLNSLEPGRFAL